jgi:hypothetical protein
VPCRTDNISFGEMIMFDILSEIIVFDAIIVLSFFVKPLSGRKREVGS